MTPPDTYTTEATTAEQARRELLDRTAARIASAPRGLPPGPQHPEGVVRHTAEALAYSPPLSRPPGSTVLMFRPHFEHAIREGRKIHTCRPERKRLIQTGARLSLRIWTGTPYRSPQRVIGTAIATAYTPIELGDDSLTVGHPGSDRIGWSHNRAVLNGFARADGFDDWAELQLWMTATHGPARPLQMRIICWRDFEPAD